jgi:DNA-binding HxlR family transcriptional regulator
LQLVKTGNSPRSGCAINAAVEVIGDRWSLIVLRDIMFGGRRHFRELQRNSVEGIATNILASRLRDLVDQGLLTRDDPGPGRPVTYTLTEPAIQLVPVLAELGWWGLRHRPTSTPLRVRAQLLYEGGPDMWEDFMAELRATHLGGPTHASGGPSVTDRLERAAELATLAETGPARGNATS